MLLSTSGSRSVISAMMQRELGTEEQERGSEVRELCHNCKLCSRWPVAGNGMYRLHAVRLSKSLQRQRLR